MSVGHAIVRGEMARHPTFRFRLDPTVEQQAVFARHAGASRFAFNHCLQTVKTGLTRHRIDPLSVVPWTGFDLIIRLMDGRRPRMPDAYLSSMPTELPSCA